MTPRHWCANGHAKMDVLFKACFHFTFPVYGHRNGGVAGDWCRILVGLVGGSARRRQSHGCKVARLTSPSVGNLSEIMPRSTQAVRKRNIRSEVSVTYAIWRVSNLWVSLLLPANDGGPENPYAFVVFMVMDTGMRSSMLRPIYWATLMPIRQLWHPVSAMAGRVTAWVRF